MVRPRKYKTEKQRVEAARERRKEWYHRNKRRESAKSLARYHNNNPANYEPQDPSPTQRPRRSPLPSQNREGSGGPAGNADLSSMRTSELNVRLMLTNARRAMHDWPIGGNGNIQSEISAAQRILDIWTGGLLGTWGHSLYITVQPYAEASRAEAKLLAYLSFGKDLQDRFDRLFGRSFTCDQFRSARTWEAAQIVRRQIARAVDVVEEFCLILRDGGIPSLQSSFEEQSLNFQIF